MAEAKQEWRTIKDAAQIVQSRLANGEHWLVLLEHETHGAYITGFQNQFFKDDRAGFDLMAVPMQIENIGTFPLVIMMASKRKVTPGAMAAFMKQITGQHVSPDALHRQDVLVWVDSTDKADFLTMMLQMFLDSLKGNNGH